MTAPVGLSRERSHAAQQRATAVKRPGLVCSLGSEGWGEVRYYRVVFGNKVRMPPSMWFTPFAIAVCYVVQSQDSSARGGG